MSSRLRTRLRAGTGLSTPSLALDFISYNTLDPRITFSRGSQAMVTDATGKLTYAPNNLLTNSESFEAAAWVKSGAGTGTAPVVTPNFAVAPDGTTTADRVALVNSGTTLSDWSWLYQTSSLMVANTTYIFSVWLKAATPSDIGKTVILSAVSTPVATLTADWQRVFAVGTTTSSTALSFGVRIRGVEVPTTSATFFIWGAQLEQVTYQTTPSPYVSTTPKNLLGYTQEFDNAAWTKSNAFVQTNLVTYSQEFDNANWPKSNVTVEANTASAPDGSITAELMYPTTTGNLRRILRGTSLVVGSVYTQSVYVKAAGKRWVYLNGVDATSSANDCWFDLQNGVVGTKGASVLNAVITAVGGGWYRISTTALAGANNYFYLMAVDDNNSNTSTTNGTDGILLWGAQLVQGSTAGDYQRTDAAAAAVQYTAPDGSRTADKLVETTATASHHTFAGPTATVASTPYTASVYLKAGERRYAIVGYRSSATNTAWAAVVVDLLTGTVGTPTVAAGASNVSASIFDAGNGWYRVRITATITAADGQLIVTLSDVASPTISNYVVYSYTGDGTSGIYVWGAQLSNSASVDPYVYNPVAAPSSTAYYGPRFDYDPVTLAPRGLLIEEQRTNRTLQSEDFTVSPWAASVAGTSTRVKDGAPLGFTRGLITATSAGGGIRQTHSSLTSGQVYALSFYIQSTSTSVEIVFENGDAAFGAYHVVTINPSNGTAGALTGFTSVSIQPFGPGYVYTLITKPAGGALAANVEWRITNSGGSIFLGRPQFEAGSFATSYIPTVASQVTRTADVATITGANFSQFYNQSEGTLLVEATTSGDILSSYSAAIVDTGVTNIIGTDIDSSGAYRLRVTAASVNQALVTVVYPIAANTTYKLAGAYRVNDFAASANGGPVGTDTSGTVPTGLSYLAIGSNSAAGASSWNGHIRSIKYFPTRLSNSQLQALTA